MGYYMQKEGRTIKSPIFLLFCQILKKETVGKGPCEANKGKLTVTKAISGTAVYGIGSDLHSNRIAKRMQTAAEKSTSSVKTDFLVKCKRPSSAATASRLEDDGKVMETSIL